MEFEGRVRVERENGLYVTTWLRLCGPHYREACTALVAHAKKHGGLRCYISNPYDARDIQNQEDMLFATSVVRELISLGCRRFIVVNPKSAITKLATNRMGRIVDEEGVERVMVNTLEEALVAANYKT